MLVLNAPWVQHKHALYVCKHTWVKQKLNSKSQHNWTLNTVKSYLFLILFKNKIGLLNLNIFNLPIKYHAKHAGN